MDGLAKIDPTPVRMRGDRPHVFLHHAPARCGRCEAQREARIVLRDGEVFALVHCADCGQTERRLSTDAQAYLQSFLARGVPPAGATGDHLFKHTTSTCPSCLSLLRADVVIRAGRVYFVKQCERCGPSEALVSEDAAYYLGAYRHASAGTVPLELARPVAQGCPADCGICPDHEQHTCLPIIELTDYCNLDCPICIVDNHHAHHMSVERFGEIIDAVLAAEGTLDTVALSGGEPTSHPALLECVRLASRDEIGRILLLTNGLRLGRDRALAEQLKELGVYVGLQLDGFSPKSYQLIRGRDLWADKQAALGVLQELDIPTQLIFVAVRGVNEDQIGQAVQCLLDTPNIISLSFQPASYSGAGGGGFAHDPLDRLTIPGVIRRIEEQSGGLLRRSDFTPLPCSHPQCVSLTYLLRLDDATFLPFPRFADVRAHTNLLRSTAILTASPAMEKTLKDVIYDVYAHADEVERGPDVLQALRRTLRDMFPPRALSHRERAVRGERQAKSISLHHYMDRHDFDLERLRKCCHHYAGIGSDILPACGYNLFRRGSARGRAAPSSSP